MFSHESLLRKFANTNIIPKLVHDKLSLVLPNSDDEMLAFCARVCALEVEWAELVYSSMRHDHCDSVLPMSTCILYSRVHGSNLHKYFLGLIRKGKDLKNWSVWTVKSEE